MSHPLFGVICGLAFGILDVLIMLPLKYETKRKKYEAMSGAFLERFMLGFIIPNLALGINPMIAGGLIGLGLSIPTAIITRAYVPIAAIGLVGGVVVGLLQVLLLK
jgi:hypothetical protein